MTVIGLGQRKRPMSLSKCLGVTLATAPPPPPQAGTHGLQILNAQKEDAGQYTCLVTNELGEAMKNYHVEVLSESGPPRAPARWARGRPGSLGCT